MVCDATVLKEAINLTLDSKRSNKSIGFADKIPLNIDSHTSDLPINSTTEGINTGKKS